MDVCFALAYTVGWIMFHTRGSPAQRTPVAHPRRRQTATTQNSIRSDRIGIRQIVRTHRQLYGSNPRAAFYHIHTLAEAISATERLQTQKHKGELQKSVVETFQQDQHSPPCRVRKRGFRYQFPRVTVGPARPLCAFSSCS